MRIHGLVILAAGALLTAGLLRADAPKEVSAEVQKELDILKGTWSVVSAEKNGKASTDEELKKAKPKLIIAGNKLTPTFTLDGKEKKDDEATITIDPSKTPKTIDLDGFPVKGKKFLGIYQLDSDKLKICLGETRPTEFASKPDSKTGLLTLKKE